MAREQLTQREEDVLRLVVGGLSNEQVAQRLGISRRTVETHMRALFRKAAVNSRGQLAALYHRRTQPPEQRPPALPRAAAPATEQALAAGQDWKLDAFAKAVRGLVERQFRLYEEKVELTLVVGEHDAGDIVVERRWTTPRPYLVYRILGPILALEPWRPTDPAELETFCDVRGQDVQADVHPVVSETGRMLLMVLFQPGLQSEAEWVLRYRSPRLWVPLRDEGHDTLRWATATLDEQHQHTVGELTVRVVFPSSWTGTQLTERDNLGVVTEERLPGGQQQFTWHQENADAGSYHWTLRGSPGSAAAQQ